MWFYEYSDKVWVMFVFFKKKEGRNVVFINNYLWKVILNVLLFL